LKNDNTGKSEEKHRKTFAISRFLGSAVGGFQNDLQGLGKSQPAER
jgi:hypothetical protein